MRPASLFVLALPAVLAAQTTPQVEECFLRSRIARLAGPEMEGRGTGQRGGALAVRYLADQLKALGLRPAAQGGYLQPVHFQGLATLPGRDSLRFKGPGSELRLKQVEEMVHGVSSIITDMRLDAPLLFVGHGIKDERTGRNDFAGADLRGRILVMLAGAPEARTNDPANPLYQGRWTHKFQEAQRSGAAGILIIHSETGAGYGWEVVSNSWTAERFALDSSGLRPIFQGWLSQTGAAKLMAAAGQDLESLRRKAGEAGFKPVDLGVSLQGNLHPRTRRLLQHNVAALLPGTDPVLGKEAIVLSAHWDHFGVERLPGGGRRTCYGAVDNASGCASLLAIAKALAARPQPRSILFLFTCGEEYGLLGAEAYVNAPLWPLDRTAANLNLESLNFAGPTRDIGLAGAQFSSLEETGRQVAARMGLQVAPTRPDPTSLFFRADHFAFVRAGVPAFSPGFSLTGGWDFAKDPAATQAKAAAFLARYHTPEDRYDPSWDLTGMVQQAQFTLDMTIALAQGKSMPEWKPDSPFQRPKRK